MEPTPDRAAVTAYWAAFREATGTQGDPADVFSFGDSAAMADDLLALVLAGTKRATAGLLADYAGEGLAPPRPGDRSVVVDGRGQPGAVLETTQTRVGPLSSVDEAFAWDEGEFRERQRVELSRGRGGRPPHEGAERIRDWWVAGHRAFFRRWFAATGRAYEEDPELVFERFRVVWPRPLDVRHRATERLVLRPWTDADRPAFAALNADPAVMEHLPEVLDRAASDAMLDAFRDRWARNGVGLWAVERRADGAFLGWTGLNPMPPGTPPAGEWEVGWRLARPAWGHGYASEAAREAVRVARELGLPRLWSMTVPANVRSIAVMRRLGMVEDAPFDHPRFAVGHRLRAHVLHRLDLDSTFERQIALEPAPAG